MALLELVVDVPVFLHESRKCEMMLVQFVQVLRPTHPWLVMEVTRDPGLWWLTLESLADLERLSTSSETLDLLGLDSAPLVLMERVLAGDPSASSSQPAYLL